MLCYVNNTGNQKIGHAVKRDPWGLCTLTCEEATLYIKANFQETQTLPPSYHFWRQKFGFLITPYIPLDN